MRTQRSLIVLFAAAAITACKSPDGPTSSSTITNSTQGTVVFTLDPTTCANYGTGPIQLFIDGTNVATPTIAPGGSSSVLVTPGTHEAVARDVANSYQWPAQNVTVAAGTSVTVTLTCV
jgi:hypothetical protein